MSCSSLSDKCTVRDAPSIICDGCEQYLTDGCPLFRGKLAVGGCFDLCLPCVLEREIPSEPRELLPGFLDQRDGRVTFLAEPSIQEFKRSVDELKDDKTYTIPWHIWKFISQPSEQGAESPGNLDRYSVNTPLKQSIQTMKVENDYSIYTELRTATKSIRLFRLAKGVKNDPIVGSLLEAEYPFDQEPYTALSYCWGSLVQTRSLSVRKERKRSNDAREPDIREFHVTASLEIALRHMRKPDGSVLLWVDALCINQSDMEERALQVGIIRDIYAHASRVAIWLGLDETSCRVFGGVRSLGESLDGYRKEKDQLRSRSLRSLSYDFAYRGIFAEEGDHILNMDLMQHLGAFFDNPWFRRLWVLQEVWSARNNIVVCGRHGSSFGWHYVEWAYHTFNVIRHYLDTGAFLGKGIGHIWIDITTGAKEVGEIHYLPILDLVDETTGVFRSSDPRDEVFGLLAMGCETHELSNMSKLIMPNYRKSVRQVFVDFTRWYIMHSRSLDILEPAAASHHPAIRARAEEDQWPSWALSPYRKPCYAEARLYSITEFRASSSTCVDLELLEAPVNDRHLRLRGFLLGDVTSIFHHFHVRGYSPAQPNEPIIVVCKNGKAYNFDLTKVWREFIYPQGIPPKDTKENGCGCCECPEHSALKAFLGALTCGGSISHGQCDRNRNVHRTAWKKTSDMYADFASRWVSEGNGQSDPNMEIFCEHVRNMLLPLVEKGSRTAFLSRLLPEVVGRLLFVSKGEGKPIMGLAPNGTEPGDSIVALFGGNSPFILRPQTCPESGARTWRLIGACHMNGMMQGNVVDDWLCTGRPAEVYDIV